MFSLSGIEFRSRIAGATAKEGDCGELLLLLWPVGLVLSDY